MRRHIFTAVLVAAMGMASSVVHAQGVAGWFLQLDGQSGPISAHSGTVVQGLATTTEILSFGQNL